MRLKLFLQPESNSPVLPFNYQYNLSAAIYNILAKASPEYSRFLHERGYPAPSGRLQKLFTFSKLRVPEGFRTGEGITTRSRRPWILYVSSPMNEEFVQNFVLGLFNGNRIFLRFRGSTLSLLITQIEALAAPVFQEKIRCKTLSPMVLSTMIDTERGRKIYYFRPEDAKLGAAVQKNLQEKLAIVQPGAKKDLHIRFCPDEAYLRKRKEAGKRVTKKITIRPGTPQATEIICFEMPFSFEGDTELMRVAYECGVGEHTSQGFGMIEVMEKSDS